MGNNNTAYSISWEVSAVSMDRVILWGKMIECSFLSCEYYGDVIQERVAGVLFFPLFVRAQRIFRSKRCNVCGVFFVLLNINGFGGIVNEAYTGACGKRKIWGMVGIVCL